MVQLVDIYSSSVRHHQKPAAEAHGEDEGPMQSGSGGTWNKATEVGKPNLFERAPFHAGQITLP